jgi:carbon-monoxide dehydrogenase large subunit
MGQFGIGQAVTRIEDQRLLTGGGRYNDDISLEGQTYAYILRSPYAHAKINSINIDNAQLAPGVLLVLTGDDVAKEGIKPMPCMAPVKNIDGSKRASTYRPILAQERVRHVGEPVAVIVAKTLHQARDAAEFIEVLYEEMPSTTHTYKSSLEGAPLVHENIANNICFDWGKGNREETDKAFAKAARITSLNLINNRVVVNSIEPRGAIGDYNLKTERSTLYTSSQGTHILRDTIGDHILQIGKENLQVITGDVGGGFGMKIFPHPEQPIVVWAARKLECPVKWSSDRTEGFMSDIQARDHETLAEMAMDEDGKFLSLRVTTHANLGAYLSHFGAMIPTEAGTGMLNGLYSIPSIWANVKGIHTNTVPTDAYRGAGRPEAIYCIERLVDKCGREMGLSQDEIRRRNFIKTDQLPYTTALGDVFDSGEFANIMDAGMERADWSGAANRQADSSKRGKLHGIGMATYVEKCGGGNAEVADIKFDTTNDHITIYIGTVTNGQGHDTAYKQIMSDRLGIDTDNITLVQGDSDRVPPGMTGGSRSVTVGGVAVSKASEAIIEKGRKITAHIFETAEADIDYEDCIFRVAGTDRTISLFDVARASHKPENLPESIEPGLDEAYSHTPDAPTFPNGCHICEIEIDPETGILEIVKYTVMDDFGDVINPLLIEGQVHGGIVQGIGQALQEHTVYENNSGQLVTASFMDYRLPRAGDFPYFDFNMRNVKCITNPLGIKGSGEAGAIGAPASVMNAIIDALYKGDGSIEIDMPATPDVIWEAANKPLAAE